LKILEQAPAKLNLILNVFPTVRDGRHQLLSIFTTLDLADTLNISFQPGRQPDYELNISCAPHINKLQIPIEKNILTRTLRTFEQQRGQPLQGSIRLDLHKEIPAAAGLGGGSSDAAALIRALAQLDGRQLDDPVCLSTAMLAGSDVSFFLQGGCALVGDTGQTITERFVLPNLDILLVKPTRGVSTAKAYQHFDINPQEPSDLKSLAVLLRTAEISEMAPTPEQIAKHLGNNLQPAALALCPESAKVITTLEQQSGIYKVLVSGSGSTVFAVCASKEAAEQAKQHFAPPQYWAAVTKTSNISGAA
jgi:4-diphosphocytidyl-2-C-methyl-D-erythritol kinase